MTIAAPVLLDDRNIFDTFDCGVPALDDWLKRHIGQSDQGYAKLLTAKAVA